MDRNAVKERFWSGIRTDKNKTKHKSKTYCIPPKTIKYISIVFCVGTNKQTKKQYDILYPKNAFCHSPNRSEWIYNTIISSSPHTVHDNNESIVFCVGQNRQDITQNEYKQFQHQLSTTRDTFIHHPFQLVRLYLFSAPGINNTTISLSPPPPQPHTVHTHRLIEGFFCR
jgi:hypothetical protein